MKTYYIQIDDCQNNPQAIVKVKAANEEEAQAKALEALHIDDSIYTIDKDDAKRMADDGFIIIDEDGEEVEF